MHAFDVHSRFWNLQARSSLSRLQLAALYAATSTLLPEPRSQMTGAQTAMELVRQCWTNKPLQEEEHKQLHNAASLGGYLAAALPLVAHDVQASATQLSFLHSPGLIAEDMATPGLGEDLATAYMAERKGGNMRLLLLDGEAAHAQLGSLLPQPCPLPAWQRLGHYPAVDVPECPVSSEAVQHLEAAILQLAKLTTQRSQGRPKRRQYLPAYPLVVRADATPLEKDMHRELQESWEAHYQSSTPCNVDVLAAVRLDVPAMEVRPPPPPSLCTA